MIKKYFKVLPMSMLKRLLFPLFFSPFCFLNVYATVKISYRSFLPEFVEMYRCGVASKQAKKHIDKFTGEKKQLKKRNINCSVDNKLAKKRVKREIDHFCAGKKEVERMKKHVVCSSVVKEIYSGNSIDAKNIKKGFKEKMYKKVEASKTNRILRDNECGLECEWKSLPDTSGMSQTCERFKKKAGKKKIKEDVVLQICQLRNKKEYKKCDSFEKGGHNLKGKYHLKGSHDLIEGNNSKGMKKVLNLKSSLFKNKESRKEKDGSNKEEGISLMDLFHKSQRVARKLFTKRDEYSKGKEGFEEEEKGITSTEEYKHVKKILGKDKSKTNSSIVKNEMKIRRVNDEGVIEIFDGFPYDDDIWIFSSTYCSRKTRVLDLTDSGIEDLTPFSKLVWLKKLILRGCAITSLFPLRNLFALEYLDLSRSSLNDVSFLSRLVNLRFLYCGHNEISDITSLSGLVNLECLNLSHCPIDDISPLSKLLKLICLFLESTDVKNITPLSKNVNLECLDLSVTPVADISPLCRLEKLTEISLRECFDIPSLSPLKGNKNIVYLDLSWQDHFSTDDINVISGFSQLMFLDLSHTDIDTSQLALLSKWPVNDTLQVLHLNACRSLTKLYPLCGFTSLTELSLSFFPKRDLSILENLSSLTKLSLKGNHSIESVDFLCGMSFLQELDLSECVYLKSIDAICNLPDLRYLNVSECPLLFSTGSNTLSLFPFVNNLEVLDISYNKIRPRDLAKLKEELAWDSSSSTKRLICKEY